METASKPQQIHIGKKISRIREIRGMKQDHLAMELGVSQQAISKIEQSEEVDAAMLDKIADVLGVNAEAIKSFSEEVLIFHIQNMHDQSTAYSYNYQCSYNPLDKVVELYERLLESEREKVALMKDKNNN
ncbi:transcriptional regulator [Pedobacter psychrophilus]|uniref:Transcriptional regulator n=1 Tax=Pedobacter psychrophilus TaxID=1826909 RepID=A0A179DCL6_9SPHI|nr:helix-turn-helix transcriptional regulator [Pedobacter psychrophilus]OAQ38786.1 transcriptional regulator [Pedobacter psychrophilus]